MQVLTTITSSPNQLHTLVLEDNETATFRLYYSPRMEEWFYDISYKDLTINCSKVVLTFNSLRQFKRIIPFGLAFFSDGNIEPFRLDDFETGRVNIGILTANEVKQIEEEVYNL